MRRLHDDDIAKLAAAINPPAPSPSRWLEDTTLRRIVVHLVSKMSIEGSVRLVTDDGILLWAAEAVSDKPVKMGGEVFIPREQILFVQTVRNA